MTKHLNGETVQIYRSISQPRFTMKIIKVGLKKDSGNATKNCYMSQKFSAFEFFEHETFASTVEISWLYIFNG